MKKFFRGAMAVLLAAVLLFSGSAMAYSVKGDLTPPAQTGDVGMQTTNALSPLKVELSTPKSSYSILSKPEVTAKISNTSAQTVKNISAGAWGYKGHYSAEKQSLAPGESFSFTFTTDFPSSILNGFDAFYDLVDFLDPRYFWLGQTIY